MSSEDNEARSDDDPEAADEDDGLAPQPEPEGVDDQARSDDDPEAAEEDDGFALQPEPEGVDDQARSDDDPEAAEEDDGFALQPEPEGIRVDGALNEEEDLMSGNTEEGAFQPELGPEGQQAAADEGEEEPEADLGLDGDVRQQGVDAVAIDQGLGAVPVDDVEAADVNEELNGQSNGSESERSGHDVATDEEAELESEGDVGQAVANVVNHLALPDANGNNAGRNLGNIQQPAIVKPTILLKDNSQAAESEAHKPIQEVASISLQKKSSSTASINSDTDGKVHVSLKHESSTGLEGTVSLDTTRKLDDPFTGIPEVLDEGAAESEALPSDKRRNSSERFADFLSALKEEIVEEVKIAVLKELTRRSETKAVQTEDASDQRRSGEEPDSRVKSVGTEHTEKKSEAK